MTQPSIDTMNALAEAIVTFRQCAYGDSNDAEIEAGQEVADIAENLLSQFGVEVPEVADPWLEDDES